MDRKAVKSSRVVSIGHHDGVLEVEFTGGGIYLYSPVNTAYYIALASSPSIGKDIQALINDKSIKCHKIQDRG